MCLLTHEYWNENPEPLHLGMRGTREMQTSIGATNPHTQPHLN